MASIFTPVNQVKLTNVSVVRLKKGGKRFELACYKNKCLEFRKKITKDLDEVLQIHNVFINVSKGQTAKSSELQECFGTTDMTKIILEILLKGEIQVSGKERENQTESLLKEIATIVADKCVNPQTKLPYPSAVIEKAIQDIHFSPNLIKNAKQQALDVIKALERDKRFPIARAQMRLLIDASMHDAGRIMKEVTPLLSQIESENREDGLHMTVLIDPGQFRAITDAVAKITKGKGTVHTLSLKVLKESEDTAAFQ